MQYVQHERHLADLRRVEVQRNWPARNVGGFLTAPAKALDVHMRRWVKASINAQQELPL